MTIKEFVHQQILGVRSHIFLVRRVISRHPLGFWDIPGLKIRKQKIPSNHPLLISKYFNFWWFQGPWPILNPSLNSCCLPQVFIERIYHLPPMPENPPKWYPEVSFFPLNEQHLFPKKKRRAMFSPWFPRFGVFVLAMWLSLSGPSASVLRSRRLLMRSPWSTILWSLFQ